MVLLEAVNNSVPYARHLGVEVTEMDAEEARARLPNAAHLTNHVGTQHAGALFSVAESASGAAMLAICAPIVAEAPPVVRDAGIRFYKPARGEITAVARMKKGEVDPVTAYKSDGRADLTIVVSLQNPSGAEVAEARFEWSFRSPKVQQSNG